MRKVSAFLAAAFLFSSCSLVDNGTADVSTYNYGYVTQDGKSVVATGIRTLDTDGNELFGSGGCMIQAGEYFYWYGEHRFANYGFLGTSCYRSKDLVHWENRGDIVRWDINDCGTILAGGKDGSIIVERPKVIYNKKYGYYVMWGHLDRGYGLAGVVVCKGNSPDNTDGSWEYVDWFRPFDGSKFNVHENGSYGDSGYYDDEGVHGTDPYGYMSRDCTLFVDDDGTAYFAGSYAENQYMHIYRLTDDYLHIDESYWPTDNTLSATAREAPCLFREGDVYYMISSGTAGWTSTVTTLQYAYDIRGPWSSTLTIGDTTSVGQLSQSDRSQPAYVFKLEATDGSGNYDWIYMGDRWGPAFGGSSPYDSQYVWCELYLNKGSSHMYFSEALLVDIKHGDVSSPTYYKLQDRAGGYIYSADTSFAGLNPQRVTSLDNLYKGQWRFYPVGDAYMIINRWSGMCLSVVDDALNSRLVLASRDYTDAKQLWYIDDYSTPYNKIRSKYSGYYISDSHPITGGVAQSSWGYRNPGWTHDSTIESNEKYTRINYMAFKVTQ